MSFLIPGSRMSGGVAGRRASGFSKGTATLFWQAAAPIGWTKITTQNDKTLRVVSGSGGVSGGTNAFSTVMAQTVVGGTSLSIAQIPAHTHTLLKDDGAGAGVAAAFSSTASGSAFWTSSSQGSGTSHNHAITLSIQYIDLILASKN